MSSKLYFAAEGYINKIKSSFIEDRRGNSGVAAAQRKKKLIIRSILNKNRNKQKLYKLNTINTYSIHDQTENTAVLCQVTCDE